MKSETNPRGAGRKPLSSGGGKSKGISIIFTDEQINFIKRYKEENARSTFADAVRAIVAEKMRSSL